MKPSKSIKTKLVGNTMMIVSLIFILVLSFITFINVQSVNKNITKTEQSIRNSLIAKGKTLANNNSMAMRGMAEDNSFTAIQTLVSSTVKEDKDIVYGIYMDDNRMPWVYAEANNPSGIPDTTDPLDDTLSMWAIGLKKPDHKIHTYKNEEVIEFASPVMLDEKPVGVIRYGISTSSMHKALQDALADGIRTRNQMIIVLLFLGFFSLTITFLIINRLAVRIARPVESLLNSSKIMADGNYNTPIMSESNDEIGNFANHFEILRLTIKKYTDHLQDLVDEKMQQVNDILNNIDQGLFTINLDATVNDGYSARANEILKVNDVASCSLNELLRLNQKQEKAFNTWLNLVKNKHMKQRWRKLTRLAPVHNIELLHRNEQGEHMGYISIDFQRIFDKNGNLSKIMLLTQDETEKRLKELQMEEERRKHENEMKIILTIANTPPEELAEFLEDTTARIKMSQSNVNNLNNKAVKARDSYPDGPIFAIADNQINAIYRDIHTIKGNSGSYGFEQLAFNAHQAEDFLEELRNPEIRRETILGEITECLITMDNDVEEICKKMISIMGRDDDMLVRIPQKSIFNIQRICKHINYKKQPIELQQLINECTKLSWKPIKILTRKYQKIISKASRKLHKNIEFIVCDENHLYPPDILTDMDDILIHIVRNAVDHGIESPEVRDELGKGIGRITFEFIQHNGSRIIKISDDGKGIDTEKLIKKCIDKAVITDEEAAAFNETQKLSLLFHAGVSTSDETNDLSGRGVGMDVVNEKIKQIDGTIFIDSINGKGTTFTINAR